MRLFSCEVSSWVKVCTISSLYHPMKCTADAFGKPTVARFASDEARFTGRRGNSDRSVQVFQHVWIYIWFIWYDISWYDISWYIMICTVGQRISRCVIEIVWSLIRALRQLGISHFLLKSFTTFPSQLRVVAVQDLLLSVGWSQESKIWVYLTGSLSFLLGFVGNVFQSKVFPFLGKSSCDFAAWIAAFCGSLR